MEAVIGYSYSFMQPKFYKVQLSQLYIFYLLPVSRHQILWYGNGRNGHFFGRGAVQFNAWCHLFLYFSHEMPPLISFGNKGSLQFYA